MTDDVPQRDAPDRCPACNGRGYTRCDCWPGDCICGFGDETCEDCGGDGLVDDDGWDDFTEDA